MKYLENAAKFLIKYYILAVPLFVLFALSNLIQGTTAAGSINGIGSMFSSIQSPNLLKDPAQLFGMISSYLPLIIGGSFLSFILGLVVYPASYGMVNKALDTGGSDLNDFVPSLQQNFVRYLLYWVGTIVVSVVLIIAAVIVLGLLGLILSVLKGLGIALFVLILIAVILAGIAISVLLSLWFSAMLIDNLDLAAAAKKSIELAKSSFWALLGITLLINIAGSIASSVLGAVLKWIPLIGPIILGAIPAATGIILIFFYLSVYREKTGRVVTTP